MQDGIRGNRYVLDRLKTRLADGKLIAVVGPDAARDLFPGRGDLLARLADAAFERGIITPSERRDWVEQLPVTRAARQLKGRSGVSLYSELIREAFATRFAGDGRRFSRTQELLLGLPFRGYIATTLDHGLVDARIAVRPQVLNTTWATHADTDSLRRWIDGSIFTDHPCPILYAYGTHERVASLVFAEDEHEALYRNKPFLSLLEHLWISATLVLVGFETDDPLLDRMIRQAFVHEGAAGGQRHFAIMTTSRRRAAQTMRADLEAHLHAHVIILHERNRIASENGALHSLLQQLAPRTLDTQEPAYTPPKTRLQIAELWVHQPTDDDTYVPRHSELEKLSRWAGDKTVHIIGITGLGGIGKTALVGFWLRQRDGGKSRVDLRGVFFWSFYVDNSVSSMCDALVDFAKASLRFSVTGASPTIRARKILEAVGVLLVLDGLEVIQERPSASTYGHLLDVDLQDLLRDACAPKAYASLLVLTSRFMFMDFAHYSGSSFRSLPLANMTDAEGSSLLLQLGVADTAALRENVSHSLGGHPLALRLFGASLRTGSPISAAALLDNIQQDLKPGNLTGKLHRLLEFYRDSMPRADASLLSVVAIFDSEVDFQSIVDLAGAVAPRQLAAAKVKAGLVRLVRNKLLLQIPKQGDYIYAAHPVLRDFFRSSFASRHASRAVAAATLLSGRPMAVAPRHASDVTPILSAVDLLLRAGKLSHALALYSDRLDDGQVFRKIPSFSSGLNCALAFLAALRGRGSDASLPIIGRTRNGWGRTRLRRDEEGFVADVVSFAVGLGDMQVARRHMNEDGVRAIDRSLVLANLGLLRDALAQLEPERDLSREGQMVRGWVNGLLGDLGAAEREFEAAHGGKHLGNGLSLTQWGGCWEADIDLRCGRVTRAAVAAQFHLDLNADRGDYDARCHWILGRARTQQGRIEEAEACLDRAEQVMRQGYQFLDLIHVLLARGHLEMKRGDLDKAKQFIEEARDLAAPRELRLSACDGFLALSALASAHIGKNKNDSPKKNAELMFDMAQAALELARECEYSWAASEAATQCAWAASALGHDTDSEYFSQLSRAISKERRLTLTD